MLEIHQNIIAALAYFDMFKFPLTRNEVFMYLPVQHVYADVDFALGYLVAKQAIYRFNGFYTLNNNEAIVQQRLAHSALVNKRLMKAKSLSRLLFNFPYVRGIAMSGASSWHYANGNSDIVLFVIAAKNRLWIAQALVNAFVKILLAINTSVPFRINYWVDEAELQIAEQNLYTATEVVTLMPLQGDATFAEFFAANAWTKSFLPNNNLRLVRSGKQAQCRLKNLLEYLFNNRIGNLADNWLMRLHSNQLTRCTRTSRQQEVVISKHFVKPNPASFQPMVLDDYAAKVAQLVEGHNDSIAF